MAEKETYVSQNTPEQDAFMAAASQDDTFRGMRHDRDQLQHRIDTIIRDGGSQPYELIGDLSTLDNEIHARSGFLRDVWGRSMGDEGTFSRMVRIEDLQLMAEQGTENQAEIIADLKDAKADLYDYQFNPQYQDSPDSDI